VLALLLLAAIALFMVLSPLAQLLRNAVFDGYQRIFPLGRVSEPAAIVVIDEATLERYGPWPWPRSRIAELVERIAASHPAAIALDLSFPDPDRFSARTMAQELPILPQNLATALASLPSNDETLARAMQGQRVVLGISAEAAPDPRFAQPPRAPPVHLSGNAPIALREFAGHIGNVPALDAAAAGRGLLNAGPRDQVVRVVPLVARVQGTIVPSLGVEALRVAADAGLVLAPRDDGYLALGIGALGTTLQDNGTAWLRFGRHDNRRFVRAIDVLEGRVAPGQLERKVVFVGINVRGMPDYRTTPLGDAVTGAEIHAQEVENIFNGVRLLRPRDGAEMEAAVLLALGLLVVAAVPRLTAVQAINGLIVMLLLLVATALVAFLRFGLLLDAAWPAIGVASVFGTVVVGTLADAEGQRRALREQAAQMAGEVNAARRIQMGLLPDPRTALAGERRATLAAYLEPARTVGGDFYDAFMADARRLFVVVADVSGKGLPAALFMAAVKSHVKSAALRGGNLGQVLTRAQEAIARENPEQLFVTAFAGALDLETGMLEYANAGHEPPLVYRRDGSVERLGTSGGPPLCVVADFAYPAARAVLHPGDAILAFTDGATEATNRSHEFFGAARLCEAVESLPARTDAATLVGHVRSAVQRFAGGAEAADDLTLLALRWEGGGRTL
jgi:adenylate cyclase